jgi:hypothetical protein
VLDVIVPDVKHDEPLNSTVPVTPNSPSAFGPACTIVALTSTEVPEVGCIVPVYVPVNEGSTNASMVPLSPAAHPPAIL